MSDIHGGAREDALPDERLPGYLEYAVQLVRTDGGCGAVKADLSSLCLLKEGHRGPHGWADDE